MTTLLTPTAPALPRPDRTDLAARAAALREVLAADAAEHDRDRRLTDRAIDAVGEAGLLRLMTPARFGGHEADVRTVLDVTTELGRGCVSTSWVSAVYASGSFMVGQLGDRAREDVFGADPDARVSMVLISPTATAESTADGLLVSGKWGYASGSVHADWIVVLVPAGAEPTPHLVLLPMADLRVEDTWLVAGLRGTGSGTVVADRVLVPYHRVQPYGPIVDGEHPHDRTDEPLYRTLLSGVLQAFLLGSMIGGARAALEVVIAKAPKRSIASSTYTSQTQSVAFQIDVAEAATLVDTAELHARRIADVVDGAARGGTPLTTEDRARLRMDAAHVTRCCREALDLLMTAHGTSAFAEVSPLQRIWRDLNVGSRHGGFGSRIPQEVYGKALLGLDPRQTSYLL